MKRLTVHILSFMCALGLLAATEAQDQTSSAPEQGDTQPMADVSAAETNEAATVEQAAPMVPDAIPEQQAPQPPTPVEAPVPPPAKAAANTNPDELRLNFRSAPIELVLNYLSDAAGFIIQLNTPVKGKVDVWSNQPVTREEAVELLNSVLNKNGYAAIRNGRMLTIMSKDDAIHGDIPVKISSRPGSIPKNDEIVTEIIPIRFVEAEQLVKDLSPMTSAHATIIANEAGNSIVVTDTQANIRHPRGNHRRH